MCSLFPPTLISASVKRDLGENEGHLYRISFSLLALPLLSFVPHSYMMVRSFIARQL